MFPRRANGTDLMKKTLITLTCGLMLAFGASDAFALAIGDANYIGKVIDGIPPGENEDEYVNSLLQVATNTLDPTCNLATTEQCDRTGSFLNVAGFVQANGDTEVKTDNPASGSVDVTGYQYLLAKYGAGATGDQFSAVWYVGNLSGVQTVPFQALSHYTLFNPGTTVPDGGATLGLLGLGMLGLGYLRRRNQK